MFAAQKPSCIRGAASFFTEENWENPAYFLRNFEVYITEWKTLWKMCKTLEC